MVHYMYNILMFCIFSMIEGIILMDRWLHIATFEFYNLTSEKLHYSHVNQKFFRSSLKKPSNMFDIRNLGPVI